MNQPIASRAVEYLRRSTTHQNLSVEFQQAYIRKYAIDHGISVVGTYIDDGKSGLTLDHRPALQSLLSSVFKRCSAFDIILVYDVSRWGRFQDIDESAHYEFLCRQAGKKLIYCAEPFDTDSTPYYGLIKNIKRLMAAEFSRSLSQRVSNGQSRLAKLGFHVGSLCPYGLRRMLLNADGKPRTLMQVGERKAMANERITLVPGPPEEIQIVRSIFEWFVNERLSFHRIKTRLNESEITPPSHCLSWSRPALRSILKDERYIGTMVFRKTSRHLKNVQTQNCLADWIRTENCIAPIIDPALFHAAQKLRLNSGQWEEGEIIEKLRGIFQTHGRINLALLAETPGAPTRRKILSKFPSLESAYNASGYFPGSQGGVESRTRLYKVLISLSKELQALGLEVKRIHQQTLLVENKVTVNIVRPVKTPSCPEGRVEFRNHAQLTLVVFDFATRFPDKVFFIRNSEIRQHYWYCRGNHARVITPDDWPCLWESVPRKIKEFIENVTTENMSPAPVTSEDDELFSVIDSMIRDKAWHENVRHSPLKSS